MTARNFTSALGLCVLGLLGCSSDPDAGPELGGGSGGTPGAAGTLPMGGSSMAGAAGSGIPIPVPPVGGGTGTAGATGTGGGNCSPAVIGLLRDFKAAHPNMEEEVTAEKGIVLTDLGPDRKPVFSGNPNLKSVTNQADFDQWYRDTPGVNTTIEHELVFTVANGRGVFDDSTFFPLDGEGFGNEGSQHNYHFTFELHMRFKYNGGEVFEFRGDDDLFVFINNKLALDLGGVHVAQTGEVDLDMQAAALGITPGSEYNLDFFQAERHRSESNFRIETNLEFTNCTPIIIR